MVKISSSECLLFLHTAAGPGMSIIEFLLLWCSGVGKKLEGTDDMGSHCFQAGNYGSGHSEKFGGG